MQLWLIQSSLASLFFLAFVSQKSFSQANNFEILQCKGCGSSTAEINELVMSAANATSKPLLEKAITNWTKKHKKGGDITIKVKSKSDAAVYVWLDFSLGKKGILRESITKSGTMSSSSCEDLKCSLRDTIVVLDTLWFPETMDKVAISVQGSGNRLMPLLQIREGAQALTINQFPGLTTGQYKANVYFSLKSNSSTNRLGPITIYFVSREEKKKLLTFFKSFEPGPNWCEDITSYIVSVLFSTWGGKAESSDFYRVTQDNAIRSLMSQGGISCQPYAR